VDPVSPAVIPRSTLERIHAGLEPFGPVKPRVNLTAGVILKEKEADGINTILHRTAQNPLKSQQADPAASGQASQEPWSLGVGVCRKCCKRDPSAAPTVVEFCLCHSESPTFLASNHPIREPMRQHGSPWSTCGDYSFPASFLGESLNLSPQSLTLERRKVSLRDEIPPHFGIA